MLPLEIIDRYYTAGPLRDLLLVHSRCVADKALRCARDKGMDGRIDLQFVEEAAMLHDIGIVSCDAPSIYCEGTLPYICHGVEGARMLGEEGLLKHALVCERHTGAGLTIDDIERQGLPLPLRDMCPQSIEEKLICYADKFFSKSGDSMQEKPLEKVIASMVRHGADTLDRFLRLHALFS